jgi:hypothetical protein
MVMNMEFVVTSAKVLCIDIYGIKKSSEGANMSNYWVRYILCELI